jgi:flagellum-specific ATP synthase
MMIFNQHKIRNHFTELAGTIDDNLSVVVAGVITRLAGMKIEASHLAVPLGTICKIILSETHSALAEVIGFSNHVTYLMALEQVDGVKQGSMVIPISRLGHARVGTTLLGRVLDSSGKPIDDKGELEADESYPLIAKNINPLSRKKITTPLDVGIRAINALMTVSKGQRMGIFAGTGVGKSVLLGMVTKYTTADVVVGLIGERGREVKEFIEENLGEEGLKKSVVVAAPADTSPLARVNGAILATAIAEYFRDRGLDVLLIVDSLTRFAQAQREISLSVGELPATKGFTPSVFAKISQLVERSGNGTKETGSITAFYTVLIEGDDYHDPIGDHACSVLDGHIVLSRQLAESGHYPAIDIEKSISRVMTAVVDDKQLNNARHFKKLYSSYHKNKDLINVGMYQKGANKIIDEAMQCRDQLEKFLSQSVNESCSISKSIEELYKLFKKDNL